MKSKAEQSKSLPGEFVKCPIQLLERQDLSPVERNLWLVLKARCMKKESCHPSVRDLCSFTGIKDTWCRQLLDQMERKGILKTVHTNGRTKDYYPLIPDEPRHSTGAVVDEPRHSTGAVESNPVTPPAGGHHSTDAVIPKPRHSTDDESDKEQIKETDDSHPPADSVSGKKTSKKKTKPSDPRVKHLIDYFCTAYEKKIDSKYVVIKGKDGQHFKDLLAVPLPLETLQVCIDLFLIDTDPWFNGKPRSIGMFLSRINNYVPQSNQAAAVPVPAAHRRFD